MKRGLRITLWILGILVVLTVLPVLFIYSGLFSVAATYPDPGPVFWVLDTTKEQSVKHHAAGIAIPDWLDDPAVVAVGQGQYREDCIGCHGAPGVKRADIAEGMNPEPPELTESAGDWQPNELFWLTKNGVRMTGMPSWQHDLTDEQIWHLVAFMRKMPGMTPAQYQALDKAAGAKM